MIVDWPPNLKARVIDLFAVNQTRSAGESITGFEQVAEGINARWSLELDFPNLKPSVVPSYRAMMAKLRGRANVLRVPIRDPHYWTSDADLGLGTVPHSDGAPFSDGSEYATFDVVEITASGSIGDKEITIDFGSYGEVLRAGLYFGLDDEAYIATSVEWAGETATVQFEPALRQDHADATVRLRPFLLMRATLDTTGRHPLSYGLITSPSLSLVEILPDELDLLEGGE